MEKRKLKIKIKNNYAKTIYMNIYIILFNIIYQ